MVPTGWAPSSPSSPSSASSILFPFPSGRVFICPFSFISFDCCCCCCYYYYYHDSISLWFVLSFHWWSGWLIGLRWWRPGGGSHQLMWMLGSGVSWLLIGFLTAMRADWNRLNGRVSTELIGHSNRVWSGFRAELCLIQSLLTGHLAGYWSWPQSCFWHLKTIADSRANAKWCGSGNSTRFRRSSKGDAVEYLAPIAASQFKAGHVWCSD